MTTPTNHRLSVGPWGLKLTPTTNSSAHLNRPLPRASARKTRDDTDLALSHVVGTTANSPNAVATVATGRLLAYTAGAAAVICTFDDNLNFTQRFYRARPTTVPLNPTPAAHGPSTPTNASTYRNRAAGSDANNSPAPFSPLIAEYPDSPRSRSWATRERIKAATCVSLSSDGRYLAVGETGYQPRVLIFSTSRESSSDCPLTCLPNHTVGVHSVAFSPDSQHLASLGTDRDGFLFIWSINSRNGAAILQASNKCTSQVTQIAWIGTTTLVSVGKRHVKVWRLDGSMASTPVTTPIKAVAGFFSKDQLCSSVASPARSHGTLHGRNCLLGPLQDCRFTAVAPFNRKMAFVCADSGEICVIDDADNGQKFKLLAKVDFPINAASICPDGKLMVVGRGITRYFDVLSLLAMDKPMTYACVTRDEDVQERSNIRASISLRRLGEHMVLVDDQRAISLIEATSGAYGAVPKAVLQLPAHGGAVLGVRPLPEKHSTSASFFSWSADGAILFWTNDGRCVHRFYIHLDQLDYGDHSDINELRIVRFLSSANLLVSGDKLGFLRFIEETSGECKTVIRAHTSEVTDVACLPSRGLVISCSRDRTIQVFQRNAKTAHWELQQTLDEHVGAVTGLQFTSSGMTLLSCSSDRTVIVRNALERQSDGQVCTIFEMQRCIQTKATPTSMALLSDRDDTLFVATMDRVVQKWNLTTGHQMASFRCGDNEGGDAVILSSLTHLASVNGVNLLAGVSSTDKSLRLYNENGSIIARDWGHTEGITDITVLAPSSTISEDEEGSKSLVTVAADGTIFIWTFGARPAAKHDLSSSMELMSISTPKDLLAVKPPLRRVLSQFELAQFRQSSQEQEEISTPINNTKRMQQTLTKKSSRFSLSQTPKLEPVPSSYDVASQGQSRMKRSPSPPSPNRRSPQRSAMRRRSYVDLNSRSSTSTRATRISTTASVDSSQELVKGTDVICRALRSYRRKLSSTDNHLAPEKLRELERELTATVRAVGEKAIKARDAFEEGMMEKFLSQYSERLIDILQDRMGDVKPADGAEDERDCGSESAVGNGTVAQIEVERREHSQSNDSMPTVVGEEGRRSIGGLNPLSVGRSR